MALSRGCFRQLLTIVLLAGGGSAYGFSASTNVALVPDQNGYYGGAGTLPISGPAFSGITFTDLAVADVSAANLAGMDTMVLNMVCNPLSDFTASQRTDIVNFVNGGGKLIIYDSDACGSTPVDYSWLPFPLTTNSPGATGTPGGTLTIVETDALASPNSADPSFIDTAKVTSDTDAVGDANVMVTKDLHWCGEMTATNVNNVTGFSYAYATYGSGIFIYDGLDTNDTGSTPGTSDGESNLAKIWLLQLQLANASTLRCSAPVAGSKTAAPALDKTGLAITFLLLLLGGQRLLARRRSWN
jgi:hypothetical protein